MPQRLTIANFSTGLETDREPFLINNDAFPVIQNAYLWRGRILKKRGTILLGRLQRNIGTTDGSGNAAITIIPTPALGLSQFVIGAEVFNDTGAAGTPTPLKTNGPGTGTLNQSNGLLTIVGAPINTAVIYYPCLPVMGLEDFYINDALYQTLVAFDTTYAYQYTQPSGPFYDVSFYKNPATPATKTNLTPVIWSGTDSQQFWSTNYANAFWVTNGKAGFHFTTITALANQTATAIVMTLADTSLVVGDVLWFNEVRGTTATGINGVTGTITVNSGGGVYTVTFPGSVVINTWTAGSGIAQILTNSIAGQDGIRWYDGDPSGSSGLGWVNFAPPVQQFDASTQQHPLYLVGCAAILPFKDRLLVFSPYYQASNGNSYQEKDTVAWSWNGTPYYSTLVPSGTTVEPGQSTYNVNAWVDNAPGFGGYISAGIQQQITTINNTEDVLLIGFTNRQTRLVYTGNDLNPFLFYSINSQLGAAATFSGVTLDKDIAQEKGALSIGGYGLTMTTQFSSQRVDLKIPDQIFEIQAANNGMQRVSGIRDFRNELVYFCFPSNASPWKFPTQDLVYNYREDTWSLFIENYTTQGNFRKDTGYTWATLPFQTWASWSLPWNSGVNLAQFPNIIGGNQQGFVLIHDQTEGIAESPSGYIQNVTITGSGPTSVVTINSPNHCLNGAFTPTSTFSDGDYIYIQGTTGLTGLNGTIRQVKWLVTSAPDANNFLIDNDAGVVTGTYTGGGTFTRLTVPFIQTKQFPIFWDQARQVRIGTQRYLLDKTSAGQITVNMYLSQNGDQAWNIPPYYPTASYFNSAIVFSSTVLTSPEIYPGSSNTNSAGQSQIWHRQNTSLVGDTVQLGFTLSDSQMRTADLSVQNSDIVIHAISVDVYPSGVLSL